MWQNEEVQFPLSHDEHAAMARYLSGIKKQLQDVTDLFKSRYGVRRDIYEVAARTLASASLLEREFLLLEEPEGKVLAGAREFVSRRN